MGHVARCVMVVVVVAGCGGETPGPVASDAAAPNAVAQIANPVTLAPTVSANAPPAGAHLNYYGGRVLTNPKVVQVLYGSGTYISQLTSATPPSMASAYTQMVASGVFDWLSTEYDTTSPVYRLGRGTFEGVVQITPSRTGALLSDASIQAELTDQINAGKLAAPDNNRIYMVHFPSGIQISQGGGAKSCVQFCAYHGTFKMGAQDVFYGVMPSIAAPTCPCAYSTTTFTSQQAISSHELIEAETDAEVGLATVVGPPLAWYDPNNGEIGDICAGEAAATYVGTDGQTYTIQTEFSNALSACITNSDIADHCARNNGGCDPNATCTNQTLGRTCTCKPGFTGDGITCTDINECLTNNGGCDAHATCANTPGSRTCTCNAGWMGNGVTCMDINECLVNNGGCDVNATCTNTPGSHTCTCNTGFTGNGVTCTDINECLTNNGGCDVHATCTNTAGSHTCTCNTGWMGNGMICTDINECLTNNGGCDVNATCTNTPGSHSCACNAGFTGNGVTCTDINECLTNNGGCDVNATCTNTPGSHSCMCNTGYAGTGMTCTDINECLVNNGGCDTNATCTNTPGSHTCMCNTGYVGDGTTCSNCSVNNGGCDANAACAISGNTRTCTCSGGYTGDGITCADIDECTTGTASCDPNATCTNVPGGFTCTCNDGYTGDGMACMPKSQGGGCGCNTDGSGSMSLLGSLGVLGLIIRRRRR